MKKLMRFIFSLIILAAFWPADADAAEAYPIWIMGQPVTNYNQDDVLGDGTVKYDPNGSSGYPLLILDGAKLQCKPAPGGGCSCIRTEIGLDIELRGFNSLDNVGESGLYVAGIDAPTTSIKIMGDGELSIGIRENADGSIYGIRADDYKQVSGDVGIYVGVGNGEFTGISAEDFVMTGGDLSCIGGPMESQRLIPSYGITIEGGSFRMTGGTLYAFGHQAPVSQYPDLSGYPNADARVCANFEGEPMISDFSTSNLDEYRYLKIKPFGEVDEVKISPKTAYIEKGGDMQFEYEVIGRGDYMKEVSWYLEGGTKPDTYCDDGYVTIDPNETAKKLTLFVMSEYNLNICDEATITIGKPPAKKPSEPSKPAEPSKSEASEASKSESKAEEKTEIRGVSVKPHSITLPKGGTYSFRATVDGTGSFDRTIRWSVSDQKGAGTKIDDSGKLTVDPAEGAAELTVTATAAGDPRIHEKINVRIREKTAPKSEESSSSESSSTSQSSAASASGAESSKPQQSSASSGQASASDGSQTSGESSKGLALGTIFLVIGVTALAGAVITLVILLAKRRPGGGE